MSEEIDLDSLEEEEDIDDDLVSFAQEDSLEDNMKSFLEVLKTKISYERLATIISNHCGGSIGSARPYIQMVLDLYTTGAESFNGELKSSFDGFDRGEVGDENWKIINEV